MKTFIDQLDYIKNVYSLTGYLKEKATHRDNCNK